LPNRPEADAALIMRVTVNDQPTDLPDTATVADLLAQLALPGTRVAVEVNRQLVRRLDHGDTRLNQGDTVEVVTLVGGG
jgi:sulfur carrier protein